MHFTPKALRQFTQDSKSVYVYPDISSLTNNLERTFAWFTTLTNINNSAYDETFKYLVLGTITETSSDITSFFNAFRSFALDYIKNPANLTVLSYHSTNGLRIPSAIDGSGQLKPTENQSTQNRRPAGIVFAKLQANIKYEITGIDNPNAEAFPFTFYVRVKTEEINVTNDRGNNVPNFISFSGPSNWVSGNNKAEYLACIANFPEAITKPFTFKKTSDVVNVNSIVEIDLEKKLKELDEQIKIAAWPVVTSFVQKKICPITHDDATMLLQNIAMQVINNVDGSIARISVKNFYDATKVACQLFDQSKPYPVNIVNEFISKTTPELKSKYLNLPSSERYESTKSDALNPIIQTQDLLAAYQKMSQLEQELSEQELMMKNVADKSLAAVKGFPALSVYEQAHHKYNNGQIKNDKYEQRCTACGSPDHVYKKKLNGEILCPIAKNNQEARERGEKGYIEILKRAKSSRRAKFLKKKKAHEVDVATLFDPNHEDYLSPVLKRQKSGDNDSPAFLAFPTLVQVLASASNTKPALPVPIKQELPHIRLPIGKANSSPKISILGAVDTCAQCSVGRAQYHIPLITAFPNLVRSITKAEDKFTPLRLSGIISEASVTDQKAMLEQSRKYATELPILVEYFLPFQPKNAQTVTGFTFKVALGNGVAMNTIIGLPFLHNTDSIIDLKDNVMSSGHLNCLPFKLVYETPAITTPPNFEAIRKSIGNSKEMVDVNIINQIKEVESFFSVQHTQSLEADVNQTSIDWRNESIMDKESTYAPII